MSDPLSDSNVEVPRVAIVGGGPGGLFVAYRLQELADHPFRATLFESSARLGGKIQTARFSSAPVSYEVGAAELYDNSAVGEDPLRILVSELGLSVSPMQGQALLEKGRFIANLEQIGRELGPEARADLVRFDIDARGRMGPGQFYDCDQAESFPDDDLPGRFREYLDQIRDPAARRYVETLIHSDLAVEPEGTNMRYGLQNYLMNDPSYMSCYSIDGGNEGLAKELAARISADVRLGCEVHSIEPLEGGRTRLTFVDGGGSGDPEHNGPQRGEFDHVVVALPHSALSRLRFETPALASAMNAHLAHYDHPAHYLRITILFERPFWRGVLSDSFCMLDAFGGCCLYDESSRLPEPQYGVLGWLLGGTPAKSMSAWSDARLIDAMLETLPASLAEGRELFREGSVHRWIGSVNALPGGHVAHGLDQRHYPSPSQSPNLLVVGDYLFDSTLNGVLESAQFAALAVASRLRPE